MPLDQMNGASFRESMIRRLESWRADFSALAVSTVGVSPRMRASLARDLQLLAREGDELGRKVEDLAVAADDVAWNDGRTKVELGWSRLLTRTNQLSFRIRRNRRLAKRDGGSSSANRPTRPPAVEELPVQLASVRDDLTVDPVPRRRSWPARVRARALGLWSLLLGQWALLWNDDEAALASARYRLMARLESGSGERSVNAPASGPSSAGSGRMSGEFAFRGTW